jgi:CRISPR-associated protein (TIGR02710 family)
MAEISVSAKLSAELIELQEQWQKLDAKAREQFFAEVFAPKFIPHFQSLPISGLDSSAVPKALISILGLSWQPVALMAARIAPEHLLIIGTSESFKTTLGGEDVLDLIARISGVARRCIERELVPSEGELHIYEAIKKFYDKHGYKPEDVVIDPTGGKKSMSASAALAGFLLDSRMVYVDCKQYFNRIPLAGTEYPRMIQNPLHVFGDREISRAAAAFDRGDYSEAEHIAAAFKERLPNAKSTLLLAIIQAYRHWNQFQFGQAHKNFSAAILVINNNAHQLGEAIVHRWMPILEKQAAFASELEAIPEAPGSIEQGMPLILNHLSSAIRYKKKGELGLAILLLYSTMERYCDLLLRVKYDLSDDKPDYENEKFRLMFKQDVFDISGKRLHGSNYVPTKLDKKPITLGLGIQLVNSLEPDLIKAGELSQLNQMMVARNKSEYEHGIKAKPLKLEEIEHHERMVSRILELGVQHLGIAPFSEMLSSYEFPKMAGTL